MALPSDILLARLRNEIRACARYVTSSPDLRNSREVTFPIEIEVELLKVPGPCIEGERVVLRYSHRLRISISKDYPFVKPHIAWLTPIFHPNIMMPEDGGYVCTKLLEDWSFNSTMISFIKGVESLVTTPNPSSPFGTDSCTAAAEYFNNGERRLPPMLSAPVPRVVGRE